MVVTAGRCIIQAPSFRTRFSSYSDQHLCA